MSQLLHALSRRGFDASRLQFALRTALGCVLAVWVASVAGLEHPQWAGMTVWIASQPMRGHLVEKSLFRVAGTISGTVIGVSLTAVSAGNPLILTLGLAIWISICTGIGNLQRGYIAYSTILAGYTAAMVSLLGSEHATSIVSVGFDRLLTVIVGVGVALIVSWIYAGRASTDLVLIQMRTITVQVLNLLASRLRHPAKNIDKQVYELLRGISMIDDVLDSHGAGSLRSRRTVKSMRVLIASHISLLLWLKESDAVSKCDRLLAYVQETIEKLETDDDLLTEVHDPRIAGFNPTVDSLLGSLTAGIAQCFSFEQKAQREQHTFSHLVVLHRDWIGAKEAMIRAAVSVLIVGLFWWFTGWAPMVYMLLGMTVMMTLFSSMEDPSRTMKSVCIGQALGVAGALICRWAIWPFAIAQPQLIALLVPFVLAGALLSSHTRTASYSFDYNMVLLLLLQPNFPLHGTVSQTISVYAAVLAAPIFALVSYKIVYPTNAIRRRDALLEMMTHELAAMAADSRSVERQTVWRARLNHRLLRLISWAEKIGSGQVSSFEKGFAILSLGKVTLRVHELMQQGGLARRSERRLQTLLKRIQCFQKSPHHILGTLVRSRSVVREISPQDIPMFELAIDQFKAWPNIVKSHKS